MGDLGLPEDVLRRLPEHRAMNAVAGELRPASPGGGRAVSRVRCVMTRVRRIMSRIRWIMSRIRWMILESIWCAVVVVYAIYRGLRSAARGE